jgi:hypothetical protein
MGVEGTRNKGEKRKDEMVVGKKTVHAELGKNAKTLRK